MPIGLGKRFKIGAGSIRGNAWREWRTGTGAVSARQGQVRYSKGQRASGCVVHDGRPTGLFYSAGVAATQPAARFV